MPTIKKVKKKSVFEKNENRDKRKKVYDTVRWRKLRAWKFSLNPLCEMCEKKGIITPAEDIHHIESFTGAESPERVEALAYDINNLMSLCKKCHQAIHNKR